VCSRRTAAPLTTTLQCSTPRPLSSPAHGDVNRICRKLCIMTHSNTSRGTTSGYDSYRQAELFGMCGRAICYASANIRTLVEYFPKCRRADIAIKPKALMNGVHMALKVGTVRKRNTTKVACNFNSVCLLCVPLKLLLCAKLPFAVVASEIVGLIAVYRRETGCPFRENKNVALVGDLLTGSNCNSQKWIKETKRNKRTNCKLMAAKMGLVSAIETEMEWRRDVSMSTYRYRHITSDRGEAGSDGVCPTQIC
jgi:hypothetical protein